MNKGKINVQMLEPQSNNGIRTIDTASAKLLPNPMSAVRAVYLVQVDKGSWDDFAWWVHGVYDCPFKADEAKRKLLAKIEEDKNSKEWLVQHEAKQINEVNVREYKMNEVASR